MSSAISFHHYHQLIRSHLRFLAITIINYQIVLFVNTIYLLFRCILVCVHCFSQESYNVVDPSKTICADFSQGNTKKFRQNAGKQCVVMYLTAII